MEVRSASREHEFHACYVELYPRLASYLWPLTRDREAAHDLAQETFARLFDRWNRIEQPSAYAYQVATNLARRTWRRNQLHAHALRVTDRAEQTDAVVDPTSEVDMRAVVNALPRRYREIVLLHYYADLSLPTIATALDRPVGTVKRQLSEARALLATALDGAG